jgi:hypothetical protein
VQKKLLENNFVGNQSIIDENVFICMQTAELKLTLASKSFSSLSPSHSLLMYCFLSSLVYKAVKKASSITVANSPRNN